MALIPPFFIDAVVAVGTFDPTGQKIWVGTGFFIGWHNKQNDDGSGNYTVYLVTNRHVLQNLNRIIFRLNPQSDQPAKDFDFESKTPDGKSVWTGHPNPNYDVAVVRINGELIQQSGMKFGLFTSDKTLLTIANMKDREVTEGDGVFVLGFPMGLVSQDRQHVILRQGAIARIRDLFENRNTDFVIDAVVFPENSGGPVILKPEAISITGTKSQLASGLIGIIKSYIPYRDVAISQQTQRPRIIFEENSGLSLVEPVDHILETIAEDMRLRAIA